jgi:hypothetical protein
MLLFVHLVLNYNFSYFSWLNGIIIQLKTVFLLPKLLFDSSMFVVRNTVELLLSTVSKLGLVAEESSAPTVVPVFAPAPSQPAPSFSSTLSIVAVPSTPMTSRAALLSASVQNPA